MKHQQVVIKSIICCALGLAIISAEGQATGGAAKVIRLNGAARFSTGNFIWEPVKVGQIMLPGMLIQTSADEGGFVDLALGDGRAVVPEPAVYRPYIPDSFASSTSFQPAAEQDVVRLWGDSLLGIDKLTNVQTGADAVNETELDLKKGHITATVKKLSAASKYEVKFVNGVAGVRGTVFDLRAQGIIKVYIGSMVVAWVDPVTKNVTTQIVMGGQAYDTAHRLISILSPESMTELAQVSSTLLLTQPFSVPGTLAVDRTAIGMSPVGANPSSIPVHPNSGGGVVITTYTGPPPPIVRP